MRRESTKLTLTVLALLPFVPSVLAYPVGFRIKVLANHQGVGDIYDDPNRIPWTHLTHLDYFGVGVQPDGMLRSWDKACFDTGQPCWTDYTFQRLVQAGHVHEVNVGLSLVVTDDTNCDSSLNCHPNPTCNPNLTCGSNLTCNSTPPCDPYRQCADPAVHTRAHMLAGSGLPYDCAPTGGYQQPIAKLQAADGDGLRSYEFLARGCRPIHAVRGEPATAVHAEARLFVRRSARLTGRACSTGDSRTHVNLAIVSDGPTSWAWISSSGQVI
jgi:hypothetical protein